jgi:hypothetical protein
VGPSRPRDRRRGDRPSRPCRRCRRPRRGPRLDDQSHRHRAAESAAAERWAYAGTRRWRWASDEHAKSRRCKERGASEGSVFQKPTGEQVELFIGCVRKNAWTYSTMAIRATKARAETRYMERVSLVECVSQKTSSEAFSRWHPEIAESGIGMACSPMRNGTGTPAAPGGAGWLYIPFVSRRSQSLGRHWPSFVL